jgi:hypothetical protein
MLSVKARAAAGYLGWGGSWLLVLVLTACGQAPGEDAELEEPVGSSQHELVPPLEPTASSEDEHVPPLCQKVPLPRVAAFASSTESARYPASAAIDGNSSTRWSSVFADPQWLAVDLGETRHIGGARLHWETAASRHYALQVGDHPRGPWRTVHQQPRGYAGVQLVDSVSATGRFLRVYSAERTTEFGVSLFEVDVLGDMNATCAGPLTQPSPACRSEKLRPWSATASSIESNAYPPFEAIDGIVQSGCGVANRWSSAFKDPQWLQIDYGEQYHFSRIVLHWECAASANYEVQVATNEGGPWATVHSDPAANGGRDDIATLNATGRFVRVLSHARRTSFGNSLYEVEVFGDPVEGCGADACKAPTQPNQTSLVMHAPNLGARFGTTTTARGAIRIAQNPISKKVYVLLGDGSLRELDLATLTTTESVAASTIVSQLPAGTFLTSVQGLAFGPEGNAYLVANEDHGSTNVGLVVKGTFSAGGWTWSLLARSEPYADSNTPFDHHWNGVVVSPDGQFVYVNSGSRTDHGEVQSVGGAFPNARELPLTARMFRLPTSSIELLLPNDEAALASYVFARGLRNTFDPAFAPDGRLLAADNGPDSDYSEELNWLREGQHYGFPWRLGNENNAMQFPTYDPALDPRLRPGYAGVGYYYNDPSFPRRPSNLIDPIVNRGPDADLFRDLETGGVADASALGTTLSTFTAHRSPLGLSFDVAGRLCGDLKQGGLLLSFGAAVAATPENGMLPDPGRDLLALRLLAVDGYLDIETRRLVSGFANPIDSLLLGSKLYVLEYGATSRVYEISLPESG